MLKTANSGDLNHRACFSTAASLDNLNIIRGYGWHFFTRLKSRKKLRKKVVELNASKLKIKTGIIDKSDRPLNNNFAYSDLDSVISHPGFQSFQKSIHNGDG